MATYDIKTRARIVESSSVSQAFTSCPRSGAVPLFTSGVYQSDYVKLWALDRDSVEGRFRELGRKWMIVVPTRLRVLYRWIERRAVFGRYEPKV